MAPVVAELRKHADRIESHVCVTAQHREMLDQVLDLFRIAPDIDLDLMEKDQTPSTLTSGAMTAVTGVLERVEPDVVLVQGDTTTAMVAALAAFYRKVPVGHVEAGLRTGDRYSPFPEEINRRIIDVLATYCFAPTRTSADALLAEGVAPATVTVTGNTVIDALLDVSGRPPSPRALELLKSLGVPVARPWVGGDARKHILVTAHRRENFGGPLEEICRALRELAESNPEVSITYPVHLNPNVREPVEQLLGGVAGVNLIDPLDYEPFVQLMARSYLVLTDSGGIQEEAPALGVPVLVMRRETERPEAVEAGTVEVVGTETTTIVDRAQGLLRDRSAYDKMARAVSPYGDGHSAARIVGVLLDSNGLGGR